LKYFIITSALHFATASWLKKFHMQAGTCSHSLS